jgi:hypothetical protein
MPCWLYTYCGEKREIVKRTLATFRNKRKTQWLAAGGPSPAPQHIELLWVTVGLQFGAHEATNLLRWPLLRWLSGVPADWLIDPEIGLTLKEHQEMVDCLAEHYLSSIAGSNVPKEVRPWELEMIIEEVPGIGHLVHEGNMTNFFGDVSDPKVRSFLARLATVNKQTLIKL